LVSVGLSAARRRMGRAVRRFTGAEARVVARLHRTPCLVVLAYHEVLDASPRPVRYSGTGISVEAFRSHVEWCRRHFPIVRLAEGIQRLRQGTLTSTHIALTFDDGDIGVERLAYPILQNLGAPATLFLCGSFLDTRNVNWLLKVLHLIQGGHEAAVRTLFSCDEPHLVRALRTSPDRRVYERLDALDALWRQVALPPLGEVSLHRQFLRQDGGRLLDLGNHSLRHVKFSWLTYDEQVAEITRNQEALSEFPNVRPLFAVPYGTPPDWNADTPKICQSLGLEFLSAHGGANRGDRPSVEVLRIGADHVAPGTFGDWFCMTVGEAMR
jgi:peptidoglycan/xylan/chitin deacetylase (PgdA/CDA1 family)